MARKIKFKKRLHNMWTWIKSPAFLLCIVLGVALFTAALVLISPCGKYDSPVHGVCSNGGSLLNPVQWFVWSFIIALPVVLLSLSGSENTPAKSGGGGAIKATAGYIQKWPKWRKKWYPVSYACFYVLFAGIAYWLNQDSGLKWSHYAVQFGVIIPFLASFPAYVAVNKARKKFKIK